MLKRYFKKQVCKSLDPDQAVAFGAAICAANLTGNVTAEVITISFRDIFAFSALQKIAVTSFSNTGCDTIVSWR